MSKHTPLEDLDRAIDCAPSGVSLRWSAWRDRVVEAARAVIADAAQSHPAVTPLPPERELAPVPVEPSIQAQRDAAWERIAARLERIAAEVRELQDEAARARGEDAACDVRAALAALERRIAPGNPDLFRAMARDYLDTLDAIEEEATNG